MLLAPVLLVSACADGTRIPPAETPAAGEPLFASEDEALEAATAAYEEYAKAVDEALASPEVFEGGLERVAIGDALSQAEEAVADFEAQGLRLSGSRIIRGAELQYADVWGASGEVMIYACDDVGGASLLDDRGNQVGDPQLNPYTSWEVLVRFDPEGTRVAERTFWKGNGVCPAG